MCMNKIAEREYEKLASVSYTMSIMAVKSTLLSNNLEVCISQSDLDSVDKGYHGERASGAWQI